MLAKGKSNTSRSIVGQDLGVGKSGIKIFVYAENDRVEIGGRCSSNAGPNTKLRGSLPPLGRKSAPDTAVTQANGSDSKAGPRNNGRGNASRDSSSITRNVQRKVLADISNLKTNCLKNEAHGASKPLALVGSGSRTTSSSSSKHIMEKVRVNARQHAPDCHTSQRLVGTKDWNGSLRGLRNKGQSHVPVRTDGKMTSRNLPPPTRISLPVLKRVSEVYTNDTKGIFDNSEKSKGTFGFPVKPRVGTNLIPHVSDAKTQIWRNRVSDGFKTMSMKSQPRIHTVGLTRKSTKPIVKTSLRMPSKVLTNSKATSGLKKSTTVATVPCTKKEEVATSVPGNTASTSNHYQLTQEALSDGNSNCTKNLPGTVLRRSDRRKSFTSLLVRSKLLEDHFGVAKQENLPNIYDDCNQLEVAEYVDDIYQYYWVIEAQTQSLVNYMEIQADISLQMRGILINWIIEVPTYALRSFY